MAKKSTEVAVRSSAAVAVPDFLKGYKGPLGTENIETADVTIPRLKIGQAITDEVKDGNVAEGSLFLNVTGQAVWSPGDKPLPLTIVARNKEYILWRPRKDGGGVLARARPVRDQKTGVTRYKWDRPNQEFKVKVEGKIAVTWKTKEYIDQDGLDQWGSEIPGDKESGIAATAHHNYVMVLPAVDNVVAALSLSRSGVKKAKDLNATLKMDTRAPLHGKVFTIVTVDETSADGDKYKNVSIKPAGYVTDERSFEAFSSIAKGFVETDFSVDHSDNDGDDDAAPKGKGGKF